MPTSTAPPALKSVSEIPDELVQKINATYDYFEKLKYRMEQGGQRWLNTKEAAKYIRVSPSHLIRNLREEIGFSEAGNKFIFDVNDLDAYLERNKRKQ